MTAICFGCDRASRNPRTVMFMLGSIECEARMLAHGKEFFDAEHEHRLTSDYIAVLESRFGADWQAGHERVKAWAERIDRV